jgi:EAL domain-containing protein (putative c-di-GMP-specific phosphodiesterase class I)
MCGMTILCHQNPGTVSLYTFVHSVRDRWLVDLLREERLTVHFQPIVSTTDPTRVFAHECLLRGLEPDGRLISPAPMFRAASEAGLLFHLDRAARLRSIRAAAEHGVQSSVFINFNPSSVYDPRYCLRSTLAAVEETGLPPERVVFEVTETEEVRDTDLLYRTLKFYREAGFRIALDDLGAGYSSLSLLAELRPDFVKLDLALIREVDRDPYRARVAAKLLELARSLEVASVAEGIERPEQLDWVREHGADYAQGFLFARPASPPPIPAGL